jgi:hypothetical protein
VLAVLGAILLGLGIVGSGSGRVDAASVTPTLEEDNPSCLEPGLGQGLKIEPVANGTYDGVITISGADGTSFDWQSAAVGVDAVIVKGGPNANLYDYDQPPPPAVSDTDLTAPINPNNNQPFGLSHLEFCFKGDEMPTPTSTPVTPTATAMAADTPVATPTAVVVITPPQTGSGGLGSGASSTSLLGLAVLMSGAGLLGWARRISKQR